VSTPDKPTALGCPQNYDLVQKRGNTKQFTMLVEVKYGPPNPIPGCEIEWFINFKNKYSETKFLNEVQYDILVVDDKMTIPPLRTLAGEEGRPKFYTAAGQVHQFTSVKEKTGTAHYVIYIYGTNPEQIVPPAEELDFFQIDIPISAKTSSTVSTLNIPTWVKNNAKWWSDGTIGDSDFISGIQYLINQGIMKIPSTAPGSGTGSNVIPTWVKNNAGWWSNGQIGDSDFVSGIQYLITNGILKIK